MEQLRAGEKNYHLESGFSDVFKYLLDENDHVMGLARIFKE